MVQGRVKVSSIINNQLPEFVRSEFPLVQEFLTQYYRSLESNGNPYDLMNNIDQYVKVDNISNLIKETIITQDITFFDTDIFVSSTAGFPEKFGLIQINNEIIVYESKTQNSFENCYRGFSGVTSYNSNTLLDELEFSSIESSDHNSGDIVKNLNSLLLSEFFNKIKTQITPGFENREFYSDLNEGLFVKESNSFYISKGTSESFRILFRALYGKPVEVILPRDFLLEPSDAQYRITKDIVVEIIEGDPLKLVNKTLYQDENSARGTITSVEKITSFNNKLISKITQDISPKSSKSIVKDYYILSLDYDYDKNIEVKGTISGEFKIHPKTKLISTTVSGQSYLDVDSTVGFKNSGILLIDLENGSSVNVTYKSKSLTQFFGCSGIDRTINSGEEIKSDDYAYVIDNDSEIKVRITGVISDVNTIGSHNLLSPGNLIKGKSLGKSDFDNIKLNKWFFNIASRYEVVQVSLVAPGEYLVTTYDDNDFKIGDQVYFTPIISSKVIIDGEILSSNGKEFLVLTQIPLVTDGSSKYNVSRKLSKLSIDGHPNLSIYNANISNVYIDRLDDSVYVACPSLPNYRNEKIKINDFSLNISSFEKNPNNDKLEIIKFNTTHIFLTGDNIVVKLNSNGQQIVGFVKKISNTQIKLSQNKDSILLNNFLDFSKYSISNLGKVEFLKFNELGEDSQFFVTKEVQPQKLLRKISDPIPTGKEKYYTESGTIGIFLNGVEIQNYKSDDYIYYGPIKKLNVLSGGFGYDVINPPEASFSDSSGFGASAIVSVSGSLEQIDIIDPGFNYLETPKIEIVGGNGTGAKAEASLISYDHIVKVGVNTFTVNNNQITFDNPHNFIDSEKIIYNPIDSVAITGLSANSVYYVKVVGITTIILCSSFENSILSIPITISVDRNLGVHQFKSVNKKRKIGNIKILDGGLNYTNRMQVVGHSGINTANNTITLNDHKFKTGEIISYFPDTEPISGLSTSNYYVRVLDNNTFRLYEISEELNSDSILRSDNYIILNSLGGKKHYFNYPEIKVNILGKYQIPSLRENDDIKANIRPIFRGEVKSIFLEDGGQDYGSEEIINYQKQPEITFNSGSNASVKLVISNGKIEHAYVSNSGFGYNSPPKLVVNGDGRGAILTPIIDSGRLVDVKVISSGGGYNQNTTSIEVLSAGEGAKVYASIKSWNICLPKRIPSLSNFLPGTTFDDGILVPSKYGYGIQYVHLYAGRELRKILSDLTYKDNFEEDSINHSPIIGWAYDGNPIYGPYGFSNANSTGGVRMMRSGYSILETSNRPTNYPSGFFVEDYIFTDSGDLDEHNGRFCITPEFPNGIYAYFATFSDERNGGYKIPQFPYIIGNLYKSNPIQFNFSNSSNQDGIDLNETNWLRNTYPYNQTKNNSFYDFFLNSYDLNIDSEIKTVFPGNIEGVEILNDGENYSINDKILFDNNGTGGKNASAIISKIVGVAVTEISSVKLIDEIEIEKNNPYYVGYSSSPHNIPDSSFVNLFVENNIPQYKKITIQNNNILLSSDIGTIDETGISTFANVSGNLSILKANDIYKIDNEIIKILNVDEISSRIRILRAQGNSSGINSHFAGATFIEIPRKINFNYKENNVYSAKINKEIYFDPAESVGLGTTSGVGITSTLYFSNPGIGKTFAIIPTRSIYLQNHKLVSGNEITYNNNGGEPIIVSSDSGISTFSLDENSKLFVTKISDDLVGISTVKLVINSEGNYSGIGSNTGDLLYFVGIGTNNYHSFRTSYLNILRAEVHRNIVTLKTKTPHNLSLLDNIYVQVISNEIKNIDIRYNDYNRRIVTNPLEILSVNVLNNSLIILNNNLKYGEKIIFETTDEIGGLLNNSIYYVNPIDQNEFRLSTNKWNLDNQIYVSITSDGNGFISKINPGINIIKYETIKFNLSDDSLSYSTGGFSRQPAFKFELFYDENYSNKIYPSINSRDYTLIETGTIGVSEDASVTLKLSENSAQKIYYKLTPIKNNSNPILKNEIINDSEQINFSTITLTDSLYNGTHKVIDASTNSFSYEIQQYPEKNSYNLDSADISYKTDSENAIGPIGEIKIQDSGYGYESLPNISVISNTGLNCNLFATSSNVGVANKVDLFSIGYNYSSDLTIRPLVNMPTILSINPFSIFDRIDVIDKGFYYNTNSNLVVIDGLTNKLVNDVKLDYSPSNFRVNIIQNTKGISNAIPTLIPVNNPNGVGISSISYDESTGNVTLFLDSTFSDPEDFPFEVGSRILVEGCNIRLNNSNIVEKNYNSSHFDYTLFKLTEINPNFGFYGASITYNMLEYLNPNEIMGTFDPTESSGSVIPEVYFPKFKIYLKKNNFIVGETLKSNGSVGVINKWNPQSRTLVISTKDKFDVNNIIIGETSESSAEIISTKYSEGFYEIKSNSIVNKFWNTEKGFLNNDSQRLHDNDYYQYFSYDLKSEIPIDTWEDMVHSLNHTSGFKKFSTLSIQTSTPDSRINTNQNEGSIDAIYSADRVIDLECTYNFDIARENILRFSDIKSSNRIFLNSRKIQDYILSIGNKVLILDDISDQFNNEIRPETYSVIDTFLKEDHRYLKYFIRSFDRRFGEESMFNVVSLIHDGNNTYLNQYGKIFSKEDLGYFDFDIVGESGRLLFYPNKFNYNDYTVCYNLLSVNSSLSGISTLSLGDSALIQSYSTIIPQNTSTSTAVVSISSTFRSSKIQTVICDDENNEYSSTEINLIHNGSEVYFTDYGSLETSNNQIYSGMGTFGANISGSNIIVSFTPHVSTASTYVINSLVIGIGDTTTLGIGTENLVNTYFESGISLIQSTPSPSPVAISSYLSSNYSSSYNLISIEDLTNNQYQLTEIMTDYNVDFDNLGQVEYGIVNTGSNLGIITSGTEGTGLNKKVVLYFTPDPNVNYEIRMFKIVIGSPTVFDGIDLQTAKIEEGIGIYNGRFTQIKKSFGLTHNQNPVFEKVFDGSSLNIIDIVDDTILVPNHYFTTGEKIEYNLGGKFGSPIGIGTTSISGIGVTDKLPSTLYVVKLNDLKIRVSASASEALKPIPEYLDLTSVGVSTNHIFYSEKQNSKSLISIDNVVQSPVVSTSKTTYLSDDFTKLGNIITVDNPLQISGGDYLKIDDEIVRSVIVGYGGSFNDILVDRQYLGTLISNHSSGSVVKKIEANYNIVGNTIHFADAPRGRTPQENPLNPEEVDFEGLKTKSSFSGRVFLRSGTTDTDITPYEKNYVFDSISDQFDGTTESFTLTSEFENISGISSNNFITLVRNIFQLPERNSPRPIEGNYSLSENVGITSIIFKPNSNTVDYDINIKNIPRGGIIVSVGSTEGFGYQPLVAAGGTAVVSSAGTIASISIGNSGSGYRSGIQTTINVGIKTLTGIIDYIGTADSSDGHIVSVAITNPGLGYTSYYEVIQTNISENISSGSTVLYLDSTNTVKIGNLITVDGYLNRVSIVSVASTFVTIGLGDTVSSQINLNSDVLIEQFSPPSVIFDSPLAYSDIPLVYSSSTPQIGLGTEATVDLVVSQDSSILSFEIKNYGYGYNKDDILTIDIGGSTGIPTDNSLPFREFQLVVDGVYDDQFASWHLGKLTVIDPIDDLIDGRRRFFPIRIDGKQISFEAKTGSNLDLSGNLIIFINDILQIPGESYVFNGGSVIEFLEPPLSFDDLQTGILNITKTKILFYEGTGGIDTKNIDILETVKVGDKLRLDSDDINYKENSRIVNEIISSDSVRTNLYSGKGISDDEKLLRNLIWCKQRDDIFLSNVGFGRSTNNYIISKARESYEPYINPSSYLIKDVNVGDTEIFVDNLQTFFNSFDEIGTGQDEKYKIIKISSQDNITSCYATPIVSSDGTISSIIVNDGGSGYEFVPEVYISPPNGLGVTCVASASLIGSSVLNISIINGGSGYSQSNLPSVLVEPPVSRTEMIQDAIYEGDFGIITGISTISVGVASTGIVFEFFIPENSYIRNSEITGAGATSISGIQSGYYFIVRNSNVGNGLISINENGNVIGIGVSFIDNVYMASNVSVAETTVVGVGTTYVAQVTVSVSDYNGLVSLGQTHYYGSYSWGRISNLKRFLPKQFVTYKTGIAGIESSPIVQRYQPLKNDLYTS